MMATTAKSYVTIENVKATGLLGEHDIAAVEALYPGTADKAMEEVSRRFDSRHVPAGEKDIVQGHVAALVVAEIKKKRGELDETTESRIKDAVSAAEEWLKGSQSVEEARRPSMPVPAAVIHNPAEKK